MIQSFFPCLFLEEKQMNVKEELAQKAEITQKEVKLKSQ